MLFLHPGVPWTTVIIFSVLGKKQPGTFFCQVIFLQEPSLIQITMWLYKLAWINHWSSQRAGNMCGIVTKPTVVSNHSLRLKSRGSDWDPDLSHHGWDFQEVWRTLHAFLQQLSKLTPGYSFHICNNGKESSFSCLGVGFFIFLNYVHSGQS